MKNRYKILHGGITATFIDTAMGSSVFQEVGRDRRSVTLDLNISFLKPAVEGWLTSQTRVIKKGRIIIVLETKVADERDRLIARAADGGMERRVGFSRRGIGTCGAPDGGTVSGGAGGDRAFHPGGGSCLHL
ncbi:uncharacterized protein (TIGR00369 family) [Kroppenstedtia sanguinis]|uniref:PaaI family thioesterase n=1 Tax=Kroppenstedtia sanguinis TaxID=1380684 RepID=UPI003D22AC2F